jgi:hypothetical protein
MQWYGRLFHEQAMERILQVSPELLTKWVEAALSEGIRAETVRLRTATLLAAACRVLLDHSPALGLRLWRTLRDDGTGPVRIDSAYPVFEAQDSNEVNEARHQVLEECHDDAALSELVLIAESTNRQEWLRSIIVKLISHRALHRRATGLVLASFSTVSLEEFEQWVASAQIEHTWVEDQVAGFRKTLRRNWRAQSWYRLFLTEEDVDRSWGAFQMVLSCADSRFFLWRRHYESPQNEETDRRLRFLEAQPEKLKERLDRKKTRKDTLFGIRVSKGEVAPFLEH